MATHSLPTPPDARATGDLSRHPADGWIPPEPWPMKSGARESLRALIRTICPLEDGPGDPDLVDRVERQVREAMTCMPSGTARTLVVLLRLFDLAPIWRLASLRRLRSLPRERAVEVLEGVLESRSDTLRNVFFPVRGVIQSAYYDQPEVHEAMDYHPAAFMKRRIDLRRRLQAGAEPEPDDFPTGGPR